VGKDCRTLYWRAIEGPEPCIRPGEEESCLIGQECLYRRNDGRLVPLTRTILSAPVYGRLQLFEILFDISDKKALERQLGLAQKLESVGLLAAGIAHEINTPIQYVGDNIRFLQESFAGLSALLGQCRSLAGGSPGPGARAEAATGLSAALEEADLDFLLEEIPKSIAQSLEGVERVAAIVSAMKRFSRLGSEEMALTDLNKAIENTLIVTRNEWKYVADVQTDLDPALPEVLCLPGDFNQVLVNIVVNAAQAIGETVKDTQRKGCIRIATRVAEGQAEIRISDDGPGIAPEKLDKIFDPFFTTKEVGKGTGQGLAIVHDIVVEKHKGSLTVDSAPGRGAAFVIRLPLPPSPSEARTGFPSPEHPEDNPGDPR
jgi:signal transduction histidine kinase